MCFVSSCHGGGCHTSRDQKILGSFVSFIHLQWQADANDTGRFGVGAQIMLYLWPFLLKENLLNGVKLLQMKQVKYLIPHFLTIQHWCGVDRKEGPEPTLNQKFFKETLRALGWFSFNCHTIWQHDRNATLLGVFPLSILNLHIIIAFHNGGIANFQRDPVCNNTLQDV
jgi:hypothetical protein